MAQISSENGTGFISEDEAWSSNNLSFELSKVFYITFSSSQETTFLGHEKGQWYHEQIYCHTLTILGVLKQGL